MIIDCETRTDFFSFFSPLFTAHSNQMRIGRRREQREGDVPNYGGVPESLCEITEGCFPKAQESKKEVGD